MAKQYLAFDLGAESGRAILGTVDDGAIHLETIHRFRTEGLIMLGTRQWDLARIYEEMVYALSLYVQQYGSALDGIAVDTWGVDFGLLAKDGSLLGNPVHYRDKRNEGMQEEAFKHVPKEEVYKATGIQFLLINTVYQLLSLVKVDAPQLKIADSLLLMGDLLGYLLTGKRACEYTNASTTQLLNPYTRTWDDELIAKLGLPRNILGNIVQPGTVLGNLLPEIVEKTGLSSDTPVITPATHDTASAVAAVPALDNDVPWAYLSSGTWSLLGCELDAPCINEKSLAQDFTNEGGVDNKIRFLKNIFGLWIVQECRRAWEQPGQTLDYEGITQAAAESTPFYALINLDDSRLLAPDNMPALIQTLCKESGQPVPETQGQIIRCALESLALKYRKTLRAMDEILDRKTARLHIIGGGGKNKLLNQMTADACGIPVIVGPEEATALGNIGIQAMATGEIASLAELRRIIANSVQLETYTPKNHEIWDKVNI